MDTKLLTETARAMVAPGKGLLAADESAGTAKKRFDTVNVESTEENRRAYREMLFTTPGLPEYVSGVILFDETLKQKTKDGVNFAEYLKKNGIIPGIKVDAGAHDMALHPGEKVSEGLDKLAERMQEYFKMGARFAKWRAVITIGEGIPTQACLDENATAHLDAMNRIGAPWPLTFSYSRALQAVALKAWRGQASNVAAAQKAFLHRARMNSLAAKGQWNSNLEKQAA